MNLPGTISRPRITGLVGASALVLGGLAGTVAAAGSADAQVPPTTTCVVPPADTSAHCSVEGSLTTAAGALNLTVPSLLSWSASLTGLNQAVYDDNAADQGYTVNDATGTRGGWGITMTATPFTTGTAPGSPALPTTGTFSTNGSTSAATDTAAPSATCTAGSTCILPATTAGVSSVSYPVAITTNGTTVSTIYNADAGSGVGSVDIGNAAGVAGRNPVGWWLSLPGDVQPGTYTSSISIDVSTGPQPITH